MKPYKYFELFKIEKKDELSVRPPWQLGVGESLGSLTLRASKEKYLRHNYSLQQSFAILSQVDVDNVPLPGPFHPH